MKRSFRIALVISVSTVLTVGIVQAASFNITSTLGGVSGDQFDVDGTMIFDSIKVGAQGVGGVTFFNGTIVNNTTNDSVDNPVTFGDNVRIDGRIYRGATAGTSDTMPFIVNDNMEIAGTLSVGNITTTGLTGSGIISSDNLASNAVTSAKITDGTIVTADIAAGSVTQAEESSETTDQTTTLSGSNYNTAETITMTTGDSNLFCMFSGYGTIDTADNDLTIGLSLDDEISVKTVRRATIGNGNGLVNMSTNAIFEVDAGEHTIDLLWNTSAGTTATMHINSLDCIELKK
ncbi:hypothetical protein KKG41_00085 [Patescibacteria group bacterium]|nr:hypothetical protein [Patescibacteria group bacterium]MBU1890565.1 hypothetical protein [Patescibacteria group bacterium]